MDFKVSQVLYMIRNCKLYFQYNYENTNRPRKDYHQRYQVILLEKITGKKTIIGRNICCKFVNSEQHHKIVYCN